MGEPYVGEAFLDQFPEAALLGRPVRASVIPTGGLDWSVEELDLRYTHLWCGRGPGLDCSRVG